MEDSKDIVLTISFSFLFIVSIIMIFLTHDSILTFLVFGAMYILGLTIIYISQEGLPKTISKIALSVINIPVIIFLIYITTSETINLWTKFPLGYMIQSTILSLGAILIITVEEYLIIKFDKKKTEEALKIIYIILGVIITLALSFIAGQATGIQ